MYEVRLSTLDFCDAVTVAAERMRQSAQRSLNHANVRSRPLFVRLGDEIRGTASELAVANWLGIPWSRSVDTFHFEADVAEDVDVRCTERHDGRLILRERDHPYRNFVLVTGTPPIMVLQGHIRGSDAMQPEWWRDPHGYGGAWFVPQTALIPVPPEGSVPPCLRQVSQNATGVLVRQSASGDRFPVTSGVRFSDTSRRRGGYPSLRVSAL